MNKLDVETQKLNTHRADCPVCSKVDLPGSSAYPCTLAQWMQQRVERWTAQGVR